ncbi:hypothetical protein SUGI_0607100 [Cryptomeria japonica]|nr:hypothetical protein SUGI_0607100 [Cryptomeria japonica]
MFKSVSWWKDVTQYLYTVEKKDGKKDGLQKSFPQIVSRETIQKSTDPLSQDEQVLKDRVEFGSGGCDGEMLLGKRAITPERKEKCRPSRSQDMEEALLLAYGKFQREVSSTVDQVIFSKDKYLDCQIEFARLEDG